MNVSKAILFILVSLLILQLYSDRIFPNHGNTILIHRVAAHNEYTESQIIDMGDSAFHMQRFRITNRTDDPVQITVKLPSCGCLSFEVDERLIYPEQWQLLRSSQVIEIRMKVRLKPKPAKLKNQFLLECRSVKSDDLLERKILSSMCMVYRDIEAHPSVLKISVDSSGVISQKTFDVTMIHLSKESPLELEVQLPRNLEELVRVSVIHNSRSMKNVGRFCRQEYTVRLHPASQIMNSRRKFKLDRLLNFQNMTIFLTASPSSSFSNSSQKMPCLSLPVSLIAVK